MRGSGKVALLSLLVSIGPAAPLFSATDIPAFHRLSMSDGLSNNTVLDIVQDHRGFIWIATQDGLNRYDGRDFKIFRHDPGDPSSLGHNYVFKILEDSRHRLWIATRGGGLNLFDHGTGGFRRFRADRSDPFSLINDDINTLYEDGRGRLWIGTLRGLSVALPADSDSDSLRFISIRHDPENPHSLSSDIILSLGEDGNGRVWIGTEQGVNILQSDFSPASPPSFRRIRHDPRRSDGIGGDLVSALHRDRQGTFWIWTEQGLARKHRSGDAIIRAHFRQDPPDRPFSTGPLGVTAWQMTDDDKGRLWIAAEFGLGRYDPDKGTIQLASPSGGEGDMGEIYAVFIDRSGVIWAGGRDGVLKASPALFRFPSLRHRSDNPESLGDSQVWSILEDSRGRLWVGTRRGLNLAVDGIPESGPPRFRRYGREPDPARGLSNDRIMDLCEGKDGSIWIATYGGGLNRAVFSEGNPFPAFFHRYEYEAEDPDGLTDNLIISLAADPGKGIWIGTGSSGLLHARPGSGPGSDLRFDHVRLDPASTRRIPDDQAMAMVFDRNGTLWVGTWSLGLAFKLPGEDRFRFLRADPTNPHALTNNSIRCLFRDHKERLWLGTHGGGLNLYDPKSGRFRRWLEEDGLPDNVIMGLLEDHRGRIWISTNHGLAEFDPGAEIFTTYTMEDGLQSEQFYRMACSRGPSGRLYFGGPGGLNHFMPADPTLRLPPPPLAFTSLRTSGRKSEEGMPFQTGGDISEIDRIVLSYADLPISVGFAALDFHNSARNHYAYRLEGRDAERRELGPVSEVTLDDLPPGRNRLRVFGANAAGVWDEEGIALDIILRAPFWMRWWFLILTAALAAGSAAAVVRRARNRRISLLEELPDLQPLFDKHHITPREREVIRLVLQGRSYQEIEKSLYISLKTVKSHIYSVYQKLGVSNRLELALRLRRAGGRR